MLLEFLGSPGLSSKRGSCRCVAYTWALRGWYLEPLGSGVGLKAFPTPLAGASSTERLLWAVQVQPHLAGIETPDLTNPVPGAQIQNPIMKDMQSPGLA